MALVERFGFQPQKFEKASVDNAGAAIQATGHQIADATFGPFVSPLGEAKHAVDVHAATDVYDPLKQEFPTREPASNAVESTKGSNGTR